MSLKKNIKLKRKPLSEINVVPYIDVMLVLLVIFMITAPLLTQGVQVQLPQAQAKALPLQKELPIVVSVDQGGQLFLNIASQPSVSITPQQLMSTVSAKLEAARSQQKPTDVYVKGDKNAHYGAIMKAMVLLQKAGAVDVGLITENPSNANSE